MRAFYRVGQGIDNLLARVRPEELALVRKWLSNEEQRVFSLMSPADQRHSIRVLTALLAEGVGDVDLLKAALLHDVGKSRCRISVLHRTLAVLVAPVMARLTPLNAAPSAGSWWLPFYVIVNHPRIGAAMLARSGCSDRVWRLTELHHLEPHQIGRLRTDNDWIQQALLTLRRVDNLN